VKDIILKGAPLDTDFYETLPYFDKFNGVFEVNNYKQVPRDWLVIITDIMGSTKAINNGKYRDVNLIGAACIAELRKLGNFPFVFGGDGASFIVSPDVCEELLNALLKIKNSALSRFDLDLRIGLVPVEEIFKVKSLKVAKFKISEDTYISKFSGGGLAYAEYLIKKNDRYLIKAESQTESSFDGLSCRWKPIQNKNGTILTLIVKTSDFSEYLKVQKTIDEIAGTDIVSLNPVKIKDMKYMSLKDMFRNEKKYEEKQFSVSSFKRKIEIIIAYLIFKVFRSFQPSFLRSYSNSMATHSDFRKFDDCLRMVIDCSERECSKILEFLNKAKGVSFGFHKSDTALMTCLVDGLGQGEHIHFIDGGAGGYTLAAAQMKNKSLPVSERN